MDGWVEEKGLTDAWRQTTQGIEMRILPPNDKTTKVDNTPESKNASYMVIINMRHYIN
jgi:hypothetical protein